MSKEAPIFVSKVSERKPDYSRIGVTMYLELWDSETADWWKKFSPKTHFNFPGSRSKGTVYYHELCLAIRNREDAKIPELLKKIEEYSISLYEEKTERDRWAHFAVQLPGDWGVHGENKSKLKKMITAKAKGRVLDAMSGFHSYFGDSPKITEVIALDFCEEALERYDHPDRKRALFDLERIKSGEKIDFFEDGYFQTIGVFFGVNYLSDPQSVYREFHRLLSEKGKLLIVGGTSSGYEDLVKKWFDPDDVALAMQNCGFATSIKQLPEMKYESQLTDYYLVEGKK